MGFIGDLPDELILFLFRKLDWRNLTQLSVVSRRFRRIAFDSSLYKVIRIKENDLLSQISTVLTHQKHSIRQIEITEYGNIEPLIPLIANCINLEILSLQLCNDCCDQFLYIIRNCKKLQSITFQHSPAITKLSELFQELSSRPMNKINIRNLNDCIQENVLSPLTKVQDLRLKGIVAHPAAIQKFCANNVTSLKTLKLIVSDDAWFSDEHLNDEVFKAIGSCEYLTSLSLGPQVTSTLNDTGFAYFYRLRLINFEIHNANGVSVDAFEKLFNQPSIKSLRKLCLYKCSSVENSVLQAIANNCCKLRKFTLERSKVFSKFNDEDQLISFVQKCTELRRLYLFSVHINVSQVLHLLPQYLPELESLKYSNSDAPMKVPSFLSILQDRMPEYQVDGLQWIYSLYVQCRKRKIRQKEFESDLICAQKLKMPPPVCL